MQRKKQMIQSCGRLLLSLSVLVKNPVSSVLEVVLGNENKADKC